MPSNCAKCGAELIGSRKFCAACGTPVGDARALGTGSAPPPSLGTTTPGMPPLATPVSVPVLVPGAAAPVNPFAATAPPNTMSPLGTPSPASPYGPPPGAAHDSSPRALSETETDPNALPVLPAGASGAPSMDPSSLVSPLAVSSIVGDGIEAAEAARRQVSEAKAAAKKPGTMLMPSAPRPATPPVSAPQPSAAPKRQDRTHVMAAFPGAPVPPKPTPPSTSKMPAAPPASGSAPGSAPGSAMAAAHAAAQAASTSGRGSAPPSAYGPAHAPPSATPPWTQGAPHPSAWGHPNAMPPPPPQPPAPPPPPPGYAPPSYGYPTYGYPPGTRVLVTWSTGQRFPATVQQVTGTQCLVLFPDGQQHWVDMQYIAPG